jgi:hypothetical protein
MYKPSVPLSKTRQASSSGSDEERTTEMITNLTMTQLLHILQRIQQLSFHSPEYARELLTQSPQLSLALIHAQYVAGNIQSQLLPLRVDELSMVKERLEKIRLAETNPTAVLGESLVGPSETVNLDLGLSRKFKQYTESSEEIGDQATELAKLLGNMDSNALEKVMQSITAVGDQVVDVQSLVQGLLNLSAEQIAALPESVQIQVLKLLEDSMTT